MKLAADRMAKMVRTMINQRLDDTCGKGMRAAMDIRRAKAQQTVKRTSCRWRFGVAGLLAVVLLTFSSTVWAAAMVTDGGFPSPNATWSLGSATNGVASVSTAQNHATLAGTGSFLETVTGRAKASTGTATQSVTVSAGGVIAAKTDVVVWAMEQWTLAASTARTITIDLRYSDATTVNIFTGTVGANSAWTNVTNTTATVFPLTLPKNVNQITVSLSSTTGATNGATSSLYADDIAITFTPAVVDSLTVTSNTTVATTAQPSQTNVQMQRLQINSDATGNGSCVITSATVDDVNIAATGTIANLKVHIDANTNFSDGVLGTTTVANWNGQSTVVDLTAIAAASRTVTSGTPKYLWVTYDITSGALDGTTCISRITALGVLAPDMAPLGGPWDSNSVLITTGLGCGGCHPLPVLDGVARTGATGAVQGNHATHGTTFAYQCNTCHIEGSQTPGGTYTSRHRRGTIEMNVSGIGAKATARYDKNADHVADTAWNQTSTPTLGKCENTDCHGGTNAATLYGGPAGAGPTWGSTHTSTCTFCHNRAKTDSGVAADAYPTAASPFRSANAAGAHLTHLTLTSNLMNGGAVACADCHTVPGTVNAAGHILTNIAAPADLTFGARAQLNTTTTAYDSGTLSCSVYCHGFKTPGGDAGALDSTPAWTANWTTYVPGTAGTCSNYCHGLPPSDTTHNTQTFPATCKNCHGSTVTTTTDPPAIVASFHINGTVEATGCATDSCHGSTATGQIWPNTSGADNGTTTPDIVGAHQLHMQWLASKVYAQTVDQLLADAASSTKQQALCQYCHAIGDSDHMGATAADVFKTTTLTAAAPKVFWGGADETGTLGTFETTGNTCSNVDCHVQYGTAAAGSEPVATPDWYVTPTHTVLTSALPTTMNCSACHNNPTSDTKHTVHTNAATTFGKTINCASCHNASVAWGSPTGTLPAANHLNGTFNVDGNLTPAPVYGGTFRTSYGSCGTNFCHRSDASPSTAPAQTTYAWNTTGMANCAICHLEAMATNKHSQHLASNSLPNATNVNECFNCHNSTATSGGVATGANHINGADDLNFATAMNYEAAAAARNGALVGASTTCNNVICHNGVTTPQWSATVTCGSCHNTGGTGPLPSAASVGRSHAAHANNDATYTDCDNCHGNATYNVSGSRGASVYTATGGGGGLHQNLTVNFYMNSGAGTYTDTASTAGGVNYNAAGATHLDDGTCAATVCHGGATPTWGGTLTNGCFDCHGGGLAATETGTTKPAIDTIPNPVTFTGQYNTYGHGRTTAYTWSSNAAANLSSYTGTATPGCYTCHSSAAQHSPAASATDPFRLGAYATNTNGLCLQAGCHDTPTIQAHTKAITGSTKTWPNNYDYKCVDCHDPHGDTNYYMVRSHISAPLTSTDATIGSDSYGTPQDTANITAVTFTALTGNATNSYGVSTATNGICEICHNQTKAGYYRRGINETNTHNTGTRCTTCHKHSDGFKGGGCSGCHGPGGSGPVVVWPTGNATGKTTVYGSHLKALTGDTITTSTNWDSQCGKCHPFHKTGTGVITIANNTTVGINYVLSSGEHGALFIGGTSTSGATEPEMCWNCHDQNNNGSLADAGDISEWGTNNGGTYNYGSYNKKSWFDAAGTWSSALFTYKNGILSAKPSTRHARWSSHDTGSTVGTTKETVDFVVCSYCHDVHDLNKTTGDTASGKPYLRGTWRPSGYKEDGAPKAGVTFAQTDNVYGAVPRGGLTTTGNGGYQIDQNNASPNATYAYATNDGLCNLCHAQASIQTAWIGHNNSVKGFTNDTTAARNIFGASKRGLPTGSGNARVTRPYMAYQGVTDYQDTGKSWMGGFRSQDLATAPDISMNAPRVGGSGTRYGYTAAEFKWGTAGTGLTNLDITGTSVNADYHSFSCSKCHTPHASRLPRLMITNCLDTRLNTWDDQFASDTNWTTWAALDSTGSKQLAYTTSAQNCHRRIDANGNGATTDAGDEPGWNTATPW